MKGTTIKNDKKALLTPAKMMAFIELKNGEKYTIVHSCFEYRKKFCANIQMAAGQHYTKAI